MTLVKLKLDDDKNVIGIGWVKPKQRKAGDLTEDGFTVYDLADDEIKKSVVFHTKLSDGHLVVDKDYAPPKMPESGPNPDDVASAALAKELASLKISNAALAKELAKSKISNAALAKQVATIVAGAKEVDK